MTKTRVWAVILLIIGLGIGYFDYASEKAAPTDCLFPGATAEEPGSFCLYHPFRLGLDLRGGSELIYKADLSKIDAANVSDAMASLRDVIERRVNAVGLTEALVQTGQTRLGSNEHRLLVQIPGVMDVNQAVNLINKTPSLEFKVERPDGPEKQAILKAKEEAAALLKAQGAGTSTLARINPLAFEDADFMPSGLTGQYLKKATLQLSQGQGQLGPSIGVEFNSDGATKFDELTKANVDKRIGIFLDGQLISAPVVREAIRDGKAEISGGQMTVDSAKELVRNLNLGALPVPVSLISTQTVGATLGKEALDKGVNATMIGFLVIAIFMIVWYRLPGVISVISLAVYLSLMIAIIKLFGITLTAGGIAGLILSLGIAVDANVLIFERLKEEIRRGKTIKGAMEDGFGRAWTSIRDSNISTIITALILFWFGTALIKGFAVNLAIGVILSMFAAVVLSRTLLLAISPATNTLNRFLYASGFNSGGES